MSYSLNSLKSNLYRGLHRGVLELGVFKGVTLLMNRDTKGLELIGGTSPLHPSRTNAVDKSYFFFDESIIPQQVPWHSRSCNDSVRQTGNRLGKPYFSLARNEGMDPYSN